MVAKSGLKYCPLCHKIVLSSLLGLCKCKKVINFILLRWSLTAHISTVFSWQNCFRSIVWKIVLLLMKIHTPPPRNSLLQKLEASLYPFRENFVISNSFRWCSVRQMRWGLMWFICRFILDSSLLLVMLRVFWWWIVMLFVLFLLLPAVNSIKNHNFLVWGSFVVILSSYLFLYCLPSGYLCFDLL